MRLKRNFFNRDTLVVAQELLGKILVRRIGSKFIKAGIVETEAYCGTKDLACHASKGLTERTKVMFGPAGFSYVYMIYGMYHCLNIVTKEEGNPSAVLIRGVEFCRGPGKLCRELKIDKKLNNIDITKSDRLWIEDGKIRIKKSQIKKSKRIGVDYAGKWKDKLWRFYL
jgi:DNA-3-methyladenine glycosylase